MSSLKTFLVATCLLSWAGGALAQADQHFHPKGKPPSEHTLAVRAQNAADLPFQDERDFEEQARGFIAAPPYMKIMADAGHVASSPWRSVTIRLKTTDDCGSRINAAQPLVYGLAGRERRMKWGCRPGNAQSVCLLRTASV